MQPYALKFDRMNKIDRIVNQKAGRREIGLGYHLIGRLLNLQILLSGV